MVIMDGTMGLKSSSILTNNENKNQNRSIHCLALYNKEWDQQVSGKKRFPWNSSGLRGSDF